jgi:hypothetical protein
VFFAEQNVESLLDAMMQFESNADEFAALPARRQALRFNAARFREELFGYLDGVLQSTVSKRLAA